MRAVSAQAALFAGTVLAGAGIAAGNVLLPAVIKRFFPDRVGSLTGLSMMLLSVGGAAGTGLAVPLEHLGGWRLSLAAWTVPAAIAVLVWGPLGLRGRTRQPDAPSTAAPDGAEEGSLLRSPLAWCVMIFMGMASLMFYTLTSWLPEIMQGRGVAPATAGTMNSAVIVIGIPLGFVVPMVAARMRDQRPLVFGVVALMTIGLLGLVLVPRAGWLWVAIFGLATGSAFPIALTLLNLRSATHTVTARLSGMAQCGGYLLAACGPAAFGMLHTLTDGWEASIWLLVLLLVPELGCGLVAARPGFVRTRPLRRTEHLAEPAEVVAEPCAADRSH